MLEVKTQEELVDTIKAIKKKAELKGLLTGDQINIGGINFGSQLSKDSKYAWTNHHQTISYNGELLDVKVPTLLGRTIANLRYIDEACFNEKFIVRESSPESLTREANTYERLIKEGFPTFESAQHLIKNNGELLIDDVLLTKKINNPQYTIDLILTSGEEESRGYIKSTARLMKNLHEKHNQIWGDAWLGNTLIGNDGKLILYDFGFKANPEKNKKFLMAKDLVSLCISSVYRTGQDPEKIVPVVLDAYNPDEDIKKEINKSIEQKMAKKGMILPKVEGILYHKPVFGMDSKRVEKITGEIYSQTAKLPIIFAIYNMINTN